MKILFDHQAFTMQHFGGVSKCFCEMISHGKNLFDYDISIRQSMNEHLLKSGLISNVEKPFIDEKSFYGKFPFKGKGIIYRSLNHFKSIPTAENINKKISLKYLEDSDFDVFHPTFFDNYFLEYLGNKPFVLTVHDMMPELFNFSKNDVQIRNKKELCDKASAIVAVSQNTKKDLCRILDIPQNKVSVIYHGGPGITEVLNKPILNFPYFLYMGARFNYKNFKQTICDFSVFSRTNKDFILVRTGAGFTRDELKLIKSLGLSDKVLHFYASDEDVKNLYANAIAFVYPSLYEGFGMPILEAFAYGCPVLLNNKSCFPAIAGDAAIYFESDEKKSNLNQALADITHLTKNERQTLIQKGYNRLSLFSWEEASKKYSKLYNSLL